ncbi:MAG: hypothetical protein KAR39_11555 [Thermoplasmata archaeon]|nr:hypothetical protein [Thermoplasmata archaeon]
MPERDEQQRRAEQITAQLYIDSFKKDPLVGLKDIRNYTEPNFIGKDSGVLYVVRCYQCPDAEERGRENYKPNAKYGCAWCGWKADPTILGYIKAIRTLKRLPPKRGTTIEEIKERYQEQYEEAVSQYAPENQEDDGEID